MLSTEMFQRSGIHMVIANAVIFAIGVTLIVLMPFGMTLAEAVTFAIATQYIVHSQILRLERFSGYGVSTQVNDIAHACVARSFGGLVWGGFFVSRQRTWWLQTLAVSLILIVIASVLFFFTSIVWLPRFILVFVGAQVLACLGEGYYWLAAGRRLYWFLPEKLLRARLIKLKCPPQRINDIVQKCVEMGLLHRGV